MNQLHLIAGPLVAISSAASHAGVIVDRAAVPATQTVGQYNAR